MRRLIEAWRALGAEVADLNDWRVRDAAIDIVLGAIYLAGGLAIGALALAGAPA